MNNVNLKLAPIWRGFSVLAGILGIFGLVTNQLEAAQKKRVIDRTAQKRSIHRNLATDKKAAKKAVTKSTVKTAKTKSSAAGNSSSPSIVGNDQNTVNGVVSLTSPTVTAPVSATDNIKTTAAAATAAPVVPSVSAPADPSGLAAWKLQFYSAYSGPAISSPFNRFAPNPDGTDNIDSIVYTRNNVIAGYRYDAKHSVDAIADWTWEPFGEYHEVIVKDPILRVGRYSLLKEGNFEVTTDARAYLPVSEASRNADTFIRVGTKPVFSLSIPDSKFSFSVTTQATWSLFLANNPGSANPSKPGANVLAVYAAPEMDYQFSPTVTGLIVYEMMASNKQNQELSEWKSDGTDLVTGVSVDATSWLNITPSLTWATGGRVALDTTTIGLEFLLKLN